MIDAGLYRIHKGAVEGGNLVSTLKFSVIGVQFRHGKKRILCISVLGHATSKACSSVSMEYVDYCLVVTQVVRWYLAVVSYFFICDLFNDAFSSAWVI
jgi:hypothetical protein